jgi:hypothetical protein
VETVNDASASPEANRIAYDLHANWDLTVGAVCPGNTGVLQVESTMAWKDVRTQEAGATGSGSWGCGNEGGTFTIDVSIAGDLSLTLYRRDLPASSAWSGAGLYAPRNMAGRFEGADLAWSASLP